MVVGSPSFCCCCCCCWHADPLLRSLEMGVRNCHIVPASSSVAVVAVGVARLSLLRPSGKASLLQWQCDEQGQSGTKGFGQGQCLPYFSLLTCWEAVHGGPGYCRQHPTQVLINKYLRTLVGRNEQKEI